MIVEVDPSSHTPVYEQIRAQVARMVGSGVLAPGTRLPTIRQLAADLGLAKGTVARAYEALLRDGVVKASGRRGTVVAEPAATLPPVDIGPALSAAARGYALTARQLGVATDDAVAAVRRELAALDAPAAPGRTAG